jgi:hypothetical protein
MVPLAIACALLIILAVPLPGLAGERLKAHLTGYEEVPLPFSTPGSGEFSAKVSEDETSIDYELTYSGLVNVLQAHIHFGERWVAGGISAFLCSNLGNGPAGTPLCPANEGTVTGTITASSVVGPAGQGIAPGDFAALLAAIRAGVTYANVHTAAHPGGEIRGQIRR